VRAFSKVRFSAVWSIVEAYNSDNVKIEYLSHPRGECYEYSFFSNIQIVVAELPGAKLGKSVKRKDIARKSTVNSGCVLVIGSDDNDHSGKPVFVPGKSQHTR